VKTTDVKVWESAVLTGGPADGLRMKVCDRPHAIQVTYPCTVEEAPPGVRAEAVFVYRRNHGVTGEPLGYGFDAASP
jgi:hypothetical protein